MGMNKLLIFTVLILGTILTAAEYSKTHTFGDVNVIVSGKEREPGSYTLGKLQIKIIDGTNVLPVSSVLTGRVNTSWIADLDEDNNPEIIVSMTSEGSGSYAELLMYEYVNGELIKYQIPEFGPEIKSRFRGRDSYTIEKNAIVRLFPIYTEHDANCCPSGGRMRVEYGLTQNILLQKDASVLNLNLDESGGVMIVKAVTGLPSLDGFSKTDCWLKISSADRIIGTTDRIRDDNSPVFNQSFPLNTSQIGAIKIELFDKDVSKDQLIGIAHLEKPVSGMYPVMFEDRNGSIKKRGEIEVVFQ